MNAFCAGKMQRGGFANRNGSTSLQVKPDSGKNRVIHLPRIRGYNFCDAAKVAFDKCIINRLFGSNHHLVMKMNPDRLFKSLSDPNRRALFQRLCQEGEMTVQQLTDGAGISQPAVSKHLANLRFAGLVGLRPEGRQSHYSARPEALMPLTNWVRLYGSFWAGKLDDLTDLLQRMDQ